MDIQRVKYLQPCLDFFPTEGGGGRQGRLELNYRHQMIPMGRILIDLKRNLTLTNTNNHEICLKFF
jgi:hypothetical protein